VATTLFTLTLECVTRILTVYICRAHYNVNQLRKVRYMQIILIPLEEL
jgi:hypothetical protein